MVRGVKWCEVGVRVCEVVRGETVRGARGGCEGVRW